MNRGRTLEITDRHVHLMAHWRPEGAHRCEINLGGPDDLLLSVGEVDRLMSALAAFKSEMMSEDGRTSDRHNPVRKALGVF